MRLRPGLLPGLPLGEFSAIPKAPWIDLRGLLLREGEDSGGEGKGKEWAGDERGGKWRGGEKRRGERKEKGRKGKG